VRHGAEPGGLWRRSDADIGDPRTDGGKRGSLAGVVKGGREPE
jgi:hypothetical protein